MVQTSSLTLEEFLALPNSDRAYELISGEAIPKMSPKRFHAGVQKALINLLDDWAKNRGHFYPEWAIILKRNNTDWVPVPDLTYISYNRLEANWLEDTACPIPPDLAIEIISPDQTFGGMAEKAANYLLAGVLRVWIIDPQAQTITVFLPNAVPQTYKGDSSIHDPLFPNLEITPQQIFQQAGLSN